MKIYRNGSMRAVPRGRVGSVTGMGGFPALAEIDFPEKSLVANRMAQKNTKDTLDVVHGPRT